MARKTADILKFEERGDDFALVRIEADGSRSEIILSAANVVHLGLLAPDFSRRLLADRLSRKSGRMAASLKRAVASTNVRVIAAAVAFLDRSGGRFNPLATERRARQLAARLLEVADRLAHSPRPAGRQDALR